MINPGLSGYRIVEALKCEVVVRPRLVTCETDIWPLEGVTLYPLLCGKSGCVVCLSGATQKQMIYIL
jgi:hypothetical protein